MARNVNEIDADEAEQTLHVMESDTFLDILHDINALKAKGKKVLGDTSAKLSKAESDHNLDKRAFAVVAGCTRMEPTRLNAFLRHFDAYREYADLDTMAGQDMFEGAPKGAGKAAGKPNGGTGQKASKPEKPPKAARKAKETPKTGKRRGRPPKKAPEP